MAGQRLLPSSTYADTPFLSACPIMKGTKPFSPLPCTEGDRRTTEALMPLQRLRKTSESRELHLLRWRIRLFRAIPECRR
jgi:hypothetical protein